MIGLNFKNKTAVFELQGILDTLIKTFTPVIVAGVKIQTGIYLKTDADSSLLRGETFDGPFIAIAKYRTQSSLALSSGILLPPFVTSAMISLSSSYRLPVIRIEVGIQPLTFRVSSGLNPMHFKFLKRNKLHCSSLLAAAI